MLKQLPHGITSPISRTARLRRLLHRGEIALSKGDLSTAEHRGRSALALLDEAANHRSAAGEAGSELRVASLELVARARREWTDFTAAVLLYRQALADLEAAPTTVGNELRLVPVLNGLGEALRLLGRFSEAEEHSRRAVQVAERIRPADPMLLAAALNGLGMVFKDTGRFRDAAAAYERALHLCEQTLGPNDPRIANVLHTSPDLHMQKADPLKVKRMYAEDCNCASRLKDEPRPALPATSPSLVPCYSSNTGSPKQNQSCSSHWLSGRTALGKSITRLRSSSTTLQRSTPSEATTTGPLWHTARCSTSNATFWVEITRK